MKKVFCVFLMVLLFAVLPLTAFAVESPAETLRYDLAEGSLRIYEDGSGVLWYEQNGVASVAAGAVIVQQSNNKTATENTITVESGDAALTISGLNIVPVDDHPIAVSPNASLSLTLEGENLLTAPEGCAGIWVPESAALMINGNGALNAVGGRLGSGIGPCAAEAWRDEIYGGVLYKKMDIGGIITIHSGEVLAFGGEWGAGISGAGITINEGDITAIGGECGAGIGAGKMQSNGTVTINGGTIVAAGGEYGAGIGGGGDPWGNEDGEVEDAGSGGTISISGGTITATGGEWAAGIGGGGDKWGVEGEYGNGGTVTISGGDIIANGGYGAAGIGGGYDGYGGIITIENASVSVSGKDGVAIGCTSFVYGGKLQINSGSVTVAEYEDFGFGSFSSIEISENAVISVPEPVEEGAEMFDEEIVINKRPRASAALVGNNVMLAVDAYGYSGLSYQWEILKDGKTWEKIEDETDPLVEIPVTVEDRGVVSCLIQNGWGNEIRCIASVYALTFSQQPKSVSALAGERVTLTAASTCPEVSYQWERSVDGGKNWFPVEGETAETLAMEAVVLSDNGLYRCVITAENGDRLASDAAEVTVSDPDAAVVYSVEHYWQTPDGRSYVLYDREILPAMQGQAVAAEAKVYVGFAENTTLGNYNGVVSAEPLVLSCYYDRKSYTAAVDVNEGTAVAGVTARYGEELPELSVPTREGYFFDGWYCDEAFTHPYAFNTMPAEDFTVYAKWRPLNATRGQEYEIGDISFRQNGYHITSHIPDGVFFAEVQMKNMSSDIEDVLVLAAYDGNGRFLKLYHMPICSKAGETFMLRTSVDNSEGAIAELKAFVLPDRGDMAPLGNTVEFPILAK